jgi:DNA-directed RNA polymerase II subunit RPB1
MVQYDGTVRTSKQQVIQFLYGEDGMAGEHIEDLKIGLMGMDDSKIKLNCSFLKEGVSMAEQERLLIPIMGEEGASSVVKDIELQKRLTQEWEQLRRDRDDLRSVILQKQGDDVHLPVNVPRIIWNAKENFGVKPHQKSDLHPAYVLEKLQSIS